MNKQKFAATLPLKQRIKMLFKKKIYFEYETGPGYMLLSLDGAQFETKDYTLRNNIVLNFPTEK